MSWGNTPRVQPPVVSGEAAISVCIYSCSRRERSLKLNQSRSIEIGAFDFHIVQRYYLADSESLQKSFIAACGKIAQREYL